MFVLVCACVHAVGSAEYAADRRLTDAGTSTPSPGRLLGPSLRLTAGLSRVLSLSRFLAVAGRLQCCRPSQGFCYLCKLLVFRNVVFYDFHSLGSLSLLFTFVHVVPVCLASIGII